jgi:hypothetical protein
MKPAITLAFVGIVSFALLSACGGAADPAAAPTESNSTIVVTIDGRDASTGDTIDPINLWDNWPTRSRVTGTTHDGEQGALLKKNGGGCLIRMQSGAQGWVTCSNFIKEFKK